MEGQEVRRPPQAESAAAGRATAGASPQGASAPAARAPGRGAVHGDVAAVIIGRAADLEDAGAADGIGLDEQALVEIGREVGLSGAAVRQALDEYHAGLLQPVAEAPQTVVGPRVLVIERTVPGTTDQVDAHISAFLRGKLFEPCRRVDHRSVWRPREGLLASIQRTGKRLGRGDRTLDDVTEVSVALVALPSSLAGEERVRVRLEADCGSLRRGLTATAVGGVALGGAGIAAAAGAAVALGDPLPLLGLPPLGAITAGAWVGPRHWYRQKLAEVELVLQGGLDTLVAGSARS